MIDFHHLILRRARELAMPRDILRDMRENIQHFTNEELREFFDQGSQPAGAPIRFLNESSERSHYELLLGSYDQAAIVALNISLRFLRS